MLEFKLKRSGIDISRSVSSADFNKKDDNIKLEDRRDDQIVVVAAAKEEKKEEGRPQERDPNDIAGTNSNGTLNIDYDRKRLNDKRISTNSPETLHEQRSRSSSHIDGESRRSEVTRRSTHMGSSHKRTSSQDKQ